MSIDTLSLKTLAFSLRRVLTLTVRYYPTFDPICFFANLFRSVEPSKVYS